MEQSLIDYVIEVFDGVVVDDYGGNITPSRVKNTIFALTLHELSENVIVRTFMYRRKFKKKYCKHILEVQDRKLNQRVVQSKGCSQSGLMGWIANPLFVGSNPILPQDFKGNYEH